MRILLLRSPERDIVARSLRDPDAIIVSTSSRCLARAGTLVQATLQARKLLICILANHGRLVSHDTMIDAAYGDDEDGGPDCAKTAVGVALHEARLAGAALGFRVDTVWGRGVVAEPIKSWPTNTGEAA